MPTDGTEIPPNGLEATGVRVCFGSAETPEARRLCGRERDKQHGKPSAETAPGFSVLLRLILWSATSPATYGLAPGDTAFYANENNTHQYDVGEKVRIATGDVLSNSIDYFTAWCTALNNPGVSIGVDFRATTALTTDYTGLVVAGTVTGINDLEDFSIRPDAIYQGEVGALGIGVLSVDHTATRAAGTYSPSGGVAKAGIPAALDSRPGCIGSALTQADGTVVDLAGEIVSDWDGGASLGHRASLYEPESGEPRLVLSVSSPIAGLARWNQIDIVGGTLATLSSGERAILYPKAVYVWTDMTASRSPCSSQSGLTAPVSRKSGRGGSRCTPSSCAVECNSGLNRFWQAAM